MSKNMCYLRILSNKIIYMKNIKFFTLKKAHCVIALCVLLCIATVCATYFTVKATVSPKAVHTIVIDAGHGGKDGGAVGKTTDVTESFLNLQYSLVLKAICEEYGFKVVLTRSDMNGLYSPFASNKKRSEMEKRKEIINKAKPDMVVSIHMNSFPNSSTRGAHVFYADGSESGKQLADSVQEVLFKNIENSHKTAKVGDYYILNCSQSPSILVECGFLSNPEEELLLQDEEYINKFCYNIFCGMLLYFKMV